MSQRYISIDDRLAGRRLNRVGINGSILYVQAASNEAIEFWSVDVRYPKSWKQTACIRVEEVYYLVTCCSQKESMIFAFFVGLETTDSPLSFILYRINSITGSIQRLTLDGDKCQPQPVDLGLESLAMQSSGKSRLCLYDRSIVSGPIPYWNIIINDETFHLIRDDIEDKLDNSTESSAKCQHFALALDAPNRKFARFDDANRVILVYDTNESTWHTYSIVGLDEMWRCSSARGVREMYGRHGRRIGAVESPLGFHVDGGACVARIVDSRRRHTFYHCELDETNRLFICHKQAEAAIHSGVDKMFYVSCTDRIFVFIGISMIAVISLVAPTLAELSTWAVAGRCSLSLTNDHDVLELCRRQARLRLSG